MELSKRLPSRSTSLPPPQPSLPSESNHTPTPSTLFDDLPEYPGNGGDIEPPSFSQVVLTLDPSCSFVQPVTNPPNEAIPLYAISTGLNEVQKHVTTIQRLYHKFSDHSSPSSKRPKIKRTALAVYEIGPGRTRCELKPLLESARYLNVIHAVRSVERGSVRWEFYVQAEKTGIDREANTKNELVKGKTEIITTHIYRTQLMLGDEGVVEWIDENDEVIAYQPQGGKRGRIKVRARSDAAVEYAEVMDRRLLRGRSPGKGRRTSHGVSEKNEERILPMEVSISTLKIVKQLERNEMDLLVVSWYITVR